MDLISERGVNLHFFPIVNARGRTYDSEIIKKKGNRNIFIAHKDSRWNYSCYKMMDFIASLTRLKFMTWYSETYPDSSFPSKNVGLNPYVRHLFPMLYKPKEILNQFEYGEFQLVRSVYNLMTIDFSINDLVKSGIFKTGDSKVFDTILDTISNYRIKTDYKINSEKPSKDEHGNNLFGYHFGYNNLDSDYQTILTYEKKKEPTTRYYINLNTIFSACFIHNLLTGGYQTIEEPFYSLSKPANMFYRLRFFMYGTLPKCHIYEHKFNQMLGLTHLNSSFSRKRFKTVIEELDGNNLIKILSHPKRDKFEVSRSRNTVVKKVIPMKKRG